VSTASLDVDTDDLVQRAEHLLDLWSTLSMQHVALGAGCGCGMGGISLRLDDFELDIVDYLGDAGVRSGDPEVVDYFKDVQQRAEEGSAMGARSRPLRRLLDEARCAGLPGAVAAWLIPKVEHTLRSYAELHGPKLEG
jgi:hypothetical protein